MRGEEKKSGMQQSHISITCSRIKTHECNVKKAKEVLTGCGIGVNKCLRARYRSISCSKQGGSHNQPCEKAVGRCYVRLSGKDVLATLHLFIACNAVLNTS